MFVIYMHNSSLIKLIPEVWEKGTIAEAASSRAARQTGFKQTRLD